MKRNGFWKGFICGVVLAMISVISVLIIANRGYLVTATAEGGLSVDDATEIVTKYDNLIRQIRNRYLFEVDEETEAELLDAAYSAFVEALGDKYSRYFTAEEYEEYISGMSGTFGGVGVTVKMDADMGRPVVISVLEDSPAGESGQIEAGDYLYAVDGTDTEGLTLDEVVELVRGDIGTEVELTVMSSTESVQRTVVLTRKKIESETVTGEILEFEGRKIAYIYITEFDQITQTQFDDTIKELFNEEGAEALILDVRNNPGGYVDVCVHIADALLPSGIVTYTLDKEGNRKNYTSDEDCLNVPMVLLVNGNSASASEILCGALKDYKAATVIGTKTYGKGIVQNTVRFVDGSAIKLTISRFYSPDGVCFHGVGIEPDWVCELPDDVTFSTSLPYEQDTQLQAGVTNILSQLKERDADMAGENENDADMAEDPVTDANLTDADPEESQPEAQP